MNGMFWKIFYLVIILICIALAFLIYKLGMAAVNKSDSSSLVQTNIVQTPVSTPTATSSSSPSKSPTATSSAEKKEEDLNKYTISVLNGGEIKGEALKYKNILEKEGFKVSSTGNAKDTIKETTIQVKKDVPKTVLDKLTKIIEKDYKVVTGDQLQSKEKFEIIITIGTQKS